MKSLLSRTKQIIYSLQFRIFLLGFLVILFLIGYYLNSALKIESNIVFKIIGIENHVFKNFAEIRGYVKNPGIYEIEENTRLGELINMAGGLQDKKDIDIENYNLSRTINDQELIVITDKSNISADPETQMNSSKVNINTSTIAELKQLPGIGDSTAAKIIQSRPFSNIEDLLKVSGIGQVKFNNIKDLVEM